MSDIILSVNELSVSFTSHNHTKTVVEAISFDLIRGKTLGVVGESGSGKSVTANAIMGFVPFMGGKVDQGTIEYYGDNMLDFNQGQYRKIRGGKIGMVFQDPMTALNPLIKVGEQVAEVLRQHKPKLSKSEVKKRVIDFFNEVDIPYAEQRYSEFPHQLSGGMRQRVVIAIAMICEPDIIIADEPTTALDVTVQLQILKLLKRLQVEKGVAVLFISHSLDVIREVADTVLVMYAGNALEKAPVHEIFENPQHPYTRALLKSIPCLETPVERLPTISDSIPALKMASAYERSVVIDPHDMVEVGEGHIIHNYHNDKRFADVRC
ncbi:MAG: ABC transporter ATP-binding protein [Fibrobacterales bacterium]